MATHSSIPAWKIPWTEEPGRLKSMGSQSWPQLTHTHMVSPGKRVLEKNPKFLIYLQRNWRTCKSAVCPTWAESLKEWTCIASPCHEDAHQKEMDWTVPWSG